MASILHFRRAYQYINQEYPFGKAFGPATRREYCISSSQNVYDELLDSQGGSILSFETLSVLAVTKGELDGVKLKALIKLFRPERNGDISKLDFLKSVDK